MILPDQPIPHNNVSLRVGGDVLLVRDHDDGLARFVEGQEQFHDFDAGVAIEISRGFIRQNHLRIVDQRPGNRDACC